MTDSNTERSDTIWQNASIAADYQVSSQTIPFVDVHFDVVRRLLESAGLEVRNLLDLGAGNGIATIEVARHQPVEHATLTEFSEPMFAMAREQFDSFPPPYRVTYVVGDFRENDWHEAVESEGPYDMVVSRFAIHHIPDEMKKALYAKVLDWLAPGGMFVNIEHTASATPLYNDAHDRLLVECLYDQAQGTDRFEEVLASYRERADGGANILAPMCDQLDWLRDIGFVDVDCAFKCFELGVFAGRRPIRDGE